jgi:predicted small lipoprotein YifL
MKNVLLSLTLLGLFGFTGCGTKELGPANAEDVKEENPEVIQKGMQKSLEYVPKNVQVPPGVLPPGTTPGGSRP